MDALDFRDRLMTVKEAAEFAGVSTKTVYRAIEARQLKHTRIGQCKGYRTRRVWLEDWFDANSVEPDLAVSAIEIESPVAPPRTARRGPYSQEQTPRRGFLK